MRILTLLLGVFVNDGVTTQRPKQTLWISKYQRETLLNISLFKIQYDTAIYNYSYIYRYTYIVPDNYMHYFFSNYLSQYREHSLMRNVSKKRKRALDSLQADEQGNHWQWSWELRGVMESSNSENRVVLSCQLFPWKTIEKQQ